MLTVYHGSTIQVSSPIVKAGRENFDFGQDFYVTKLKSKPKEGLYV